jgi:hypothetical protein
MTRGITSGARPNERQLFPASGKEPTVLGVVEMHVAAAADRMTATM